MRHFMQLVLLHFMRYAEKQVMRHSALESAMTVPRLTEPAKTRKSLPLSEKDLAAIARLRVETPERQALSELAGAHDL
jgi:hypothetical protein